MKEVFLAVVEDDSEDSEFFCTALNSNFSNLQIATFSDGNEFFEYLNKAIELPDLVITDLRMPLMSGFEVIEKLKGNPETKKIPIVVLSTSGNPSDIKKATELGAVAYFVKPYTFAEYSAITEEILGSLNKVNS